MARVTGTPQYFGIGGVANPAGQSINVPADAQACAVWWEGYDSQGDTLATLSLTGADAFTIRHDVPTSGDVSCGGMAVALVNTTGSQTIDWSWDGTPEYGPGVHVCFLADIDTANLVRDSDIAVTGDAVNATVTIDSSVTDCVVGLDSRYSPANTEIPPNATGWTSLSTGIVVNRGSRLRQLDSPGATSTINSEDDSYATVILASFRNAPIANVVAKKALHVLNMMRH